MQNSQVLSENIKELGTHVNDVFWFKTEKHITELP